MGFDDLRPKRAKTYDTWGMIGTKHGAEAPTCEAGPTLSDILDAAFAPPMWSVERRARQIAADKMRLVKDPTGAKLPDELWRQAIPQAEAEAKAADEEDGDFGPWTAVDPEPLP